MVVITRTEKNGLITALVRSDIGVIFDMVVITRTEKNGLITATPF